MRCRRFPAGGLGVSSKTRRFRGLKVFPPASTEKLAHDIELFGKEVEHKGEVINEKNGKAGVFNC